MTPVSTKPWHGYVKDIDWPIAKLQWEALWECEDAQRPYTLLRPDYFLN